MTTRRAPAATVPQGTWASPYGPEVGQPVGSTYQPLARLDPWQSVVIARG